MFHQIYELMVLGMHPAISHSRRSQIRPLDRRAPDALPACFLIVRAGPANKAPSNVLAFEAAPLRPDERKLGAALGRAVRRNKRQRDNKHRTLIEAAAVDVDAAAMQADQVADNRETHTEAVVRARR